MNICIDMRPALSRPTGVGVYLQNLVAALSEIDAENQYHLFSSSWKERSKVAGSRSELRMEPSQFPFHRAIAWNSSPGGTFTNSAGNSNPQSTKHHDGS
jgi:hypothetical protein